ncbi:hypothetical protein C900_02912 [Fulvivirga imtechensis AK7]|uniref:Uncharacterized protein n=1 Tax=Fulvivirga imtechensis AK7 TaxID=1237149 RepID=L8JVP7_9BACT|nr:hypothetical protein C900_02912 [Fulvivirga imtechensis AK7]
MFVAKKTAILDLAAEFLSKHFIKIKNPKSNVFSGNLYHP